MSEQSNDPASFPCTMCCRQILKGARKCIHCDSYQDWRRFFFFSQATFVLLIAFITVASSTVPPLYDWLTAKSDVQVELRQVYLYYFELSASNSGNRPGRLVNITMKALTSSGDPPEPLFLQVYGSGWVGPNQSIPLYVFVSPESLAEFMNWPHRNIAKCTLEAQIVNYRDKPKVISVDCTGANYQMFCRSSENVAILQGKVQALPPDSTGSFTSRCNLTP